MVDQTAQYLSNTIKFFLSGSAFSGAFNTACVVVFAQNDESENSVREDEMVLLSLKA